jgi:hypothetical protein
MKSFDAESWSPNQAQQDRKPADLERPRIRSADRRANYDGHDAPAARDTRPMGFVDIAPRCSIQAGISTPWQLLAYEPRICR